MTGQLDEILDDHELLLAENERLRAELRQMERDMADAELTSARQQESSRVKQNLQITIDLQKSVEQEFTQQDKTRNEVIYENGKMTQSVGETKDVFEDLSHNLYTTETELNAIKLVNESLEFKCNELECENERLINKVDQLNVERKDDSSVAIETLQLKNVQLTDELIRLKYILELEFLKNFPHDGGKVREIRVVRCIADSKQNGALGSGTGDDVEQPRQIFDFDGREASELVSSHERLAKENDLLRAKLNDIPTVG